MSWLPYHIILESPGVWDGFEFIDRKNDPEKE